MKQVPALLTSSILFVLALTSGITNADVLKEYEIDFNILETEYNSQTPISNPIFEEFQIESNFIFGHNFANSYTVGLNYTDVTIVNNDRSSKSNSNLLLMLQFEF